MADNETGVSAPAERQVSIQWKRLAMQAMRYLNAEQRVAATKAAGVEAHIRGVSPVSAPAEDRTPPRCGNCGGELERIRAEGIFECRACGFTHRNREAWYAAGEFAPNEQRAAAPPLAGVDRTPSDVEELRWTIAQGLDSDPFAEKWEHEGAHAALRTLCDHVARLTAELADYALLKQAVNHSADCGPTCTPDGCAEDCPRLNTARWLTDQQREITRLTAALDRATTELDSLRTTDRLTRNLVSQPAFQAFARLVEAVGGDSHV